MKVSDLDVGSRSLLKRSFREYKSVLQLNNLLINRLMTSHIEDITDYFYDMDLRKCSNNKCNRIFYEGYLMGELAYTFCSRECVQVMYPAIEEDDYGTEVIYYTSWRD